MRPWGIPESLAAPRNPHVGLMLNIEFEERIPYGEGEGHDGEHKPITKAQSGHVACEAHLVSR
jgi:hypothetical protein